MKGGFRGSVNRGGKNPAAVLTNEQAKQARLDFLDGAHTAETLARKYNVSASAMKRLLTGESFVDAGGPRFSRLPTFQELSRGARARDFVTGGGRG